MKKNAMWFLIGAAVFLVACGGPSSSIRTLKGEPKGPAKSPPCPESDARIPSGEGMWPWTSLHERSEDELRSRGLKVPLEELWTEGKGGLLRAAVGLRGCSASFVSPGGLMITNHHCAFQAINRNSSPEKNLLQDGYLASTRGDELDGKGLTAYVFQSHKDITADVLSGVPEDVGDLERMELIERREKEIVADCEKKPDTRCRVSRNNDGLSFVLLEHLELRDIRLVAVPPRSLGEYGGEIDNWHWPRHTMDFAFLRAYVSPDGKPADYHESNVPYHPERHFEVDRRGVERGDLVMVVGTPYRTSRYRTATAVRDDLTWYYPTRVDLFEQWLAVLAQTCEKIPQTCLSTASRVKSLGNALTNAQGMIAGLKRGRVLEKKVELENRWRQWVEQNPKRKEDFGGALDALSSYLENSRAGRDRDVLVRYMIWGVSTLNFARTITKWAAEQEKPDVEREPGYQDRDKEIILSDLRQAQGNLSLEADKAVLAMFLERLGSLPKGERLGTFDERLGKDYSARKIERFIGALYAETRLGDEHRRVELFGRSVGELSKSADPLIALALKMAPELDAIEKKQKEEQGALSRLRPIYISSLVEMLGTSFYPDANATPRLSFATVAGYAPFDGAVYTPFTTLEGLVAKHTGKPPFDAPQGLLEAVEQRDASFAHPRLKDVPVCFLANADTTGGNSGSPALSGSGRLVGLNFDRVYQNIAGDYGYNTELSRNIMVDVRGILWYLSSVVQARRLLDEMKVSASE